MTTQQIMEQAQVFASAWSLVGSRFDSGNEIDNANEQKECMKQMLVALAAAHKVERDALTNAARLALDALEDHTAQTRPIERTYIAIEILNAVL